MSTTTSAGPAAGRKPDRARANEADQIAAAMAGIRAALEERAGDRYAARDLAGYDTYGLGRLLRPRLDGDPRGLRAVAREIGVTAPDLSRICGGQPVSAGKVFAVADWLGIDPRRFYRPAKRGKAEAKAGAPAGAKAGAKAAKRARRSTGNPLKQRKGTET